MQDAGNAMQRFRFDMLHRKCIQTYCLFVVCAGLAACDRQTIDTERTNPDAAVADPGMVNATEPGDGTGKLLDAGINSDAPGSEHAASPETSTVESANETRASSYRSSLSQAEQKEDWTTQRIIALAPGGPVVIELAVNLDGVDLPAAWKTVSAQLAAEILGDLEQPIDWEILLEQPLVKSGWLGNLIPEENQRDQLISMYDRQRDGKVAPEELALFLSRGLARAAPLQIRDQGSEVGVMYGSYPWGFIDSDQDNTLDENELTQAETRLLQLDYNGDGIVTGAELRESHEQPAMMEGSSQPSLLETNSAVFMASADDSDQAATDREIRRAAVAVLGHYTFLQGIPRADWQTWSDRQWQMLDRDGNDSVDRSELAAIWSLEPHQRIHLRFPALENPADVFLIQADNTADAADQTSVVTPEKLTGGRGTVAQPTASRGASGNRTRLSTVNCVTEVHVSDSFTGGTPRLLRRLLAESLTDPQQRAAVERRFQLKEGAIELADPNRDSELSDDEFAMVWRWMSARQGTRLLVRWMKSANPWFQLLDSNSDQRLTPMELKAAGDRLLALDENGDRTLTVNELPLLARMQIERTDSRLAPAEGPVPSDPEEALADGDWFSAMDTNRDGYLGSLEFLGSPEIFGRLDTDKDGSISRNEVYEQQASY